MKRNRAWELHIYGAPQYAIAAELGITQAPVSQYIAHVAKNHPVNKLTLEQRMAISEERWNISERDIREEIEEQRRNGRIVREVLRLPNGQEQVRVTKTEGVDPALLRALSTQRTMTAAHGNSTTS